MEPAQPKTMAIVCERCNKHHVIPFDGVYEHVEFQTHKVGFRWGQHPNGLWWTRCKKCAEYVQARNNGSAFQSVTVPPVGGCNTYSKGISSCHTSTNEAEPTPFAFEAKIYTGEVFPSRPRTADLPNVVRQAHRGNRLSPRSHRQRRRWDAVQLYALRRKSSEGFQDVTERPWEPHRHRRGLANFFDTKSEK